MFNQELLEKLRKSISVLETEIENAKLKDHIRKNKNIMHRLCAYTEMIEKQKNSLNQLDFYIQKNNLIEIYKEITFINNISSFIKEDTKEILDEVKGNPLRKQNYH